MSKRTRCEITACPEKGDRHVTPIRIENLPDAPPMLMCARHATIAEAAIAARTEKKD